MKKRNLQRIFAAFMATALAVSTAACSKEQPDAGKDNTTPTTAPKADDKKDEPKKDDPVDTPVDTPDDGEGEIEKLTHSDGSPIDLGGMEIIIRDWWSVPGQEPKNEHDEAVLEWREWCQETYNFTITQQAISDWGSAPQDFVDYASAPDDGNAYMFILRDDPAIASGFSKGLFYDLASLDCLDFSTDLFVNGTHNLYTFGDKIYGMAAGPSEPRTGVYFNKNVLRDAGIDPDEIYDLQAKNQWTWDKFAEMMDKVQRDVDNDGVDDYFGLTLNEGVMIDQSVFSNGGSYVYRDANGKFVYNLEDPKTVQALEWCKDMFTKYDDHDPEGAAWDYYKEEFLAGHVGFMVDQEYCGSAGGDGNFLWSGAGFDESFEYGFVQFPIGPATDHYVNIWSNNIIALPACYSPEKAWNIAFAWMLYNTEPAGYEGRIGFLDQARDGNFDERAIEETIPRMCTENGGFDVSGQVPGLDKTLVQYHINKWEDVSAVIESARDSWKEMIKQANGD